ncbi:hypothetical protein ACLM5J_03655 [Nocardioides sp. Bht2]|uniref:hypothetical protein n=1 Tax=Nocardioides sp. Bht2 TaxID=3392297 RepID=UPI0039B645B0
MPNTRQGTIRHKDGCHGGPLSESTGKRGDIRVKCAICKAYTFIPAPPTPQPEPVPAAVVAESLMTYRLWMGCVDCGADMWVTSNRPRVARCRNCTHAHRSRAQRRAERAVAISKRRVVA